MIAALGGEGGGVLADWIIAAATAQGFPVQSTSVPGVAQRTGATNYYLEILPVSRAELCGREPVFSLVPYPGDVSIVAASELVEAGRMLQGGYVHPQKTVLVASTHREYAVSEKSAMGDGRYDGERVMSAAATLAHEAILFDMAVLAARHRTVINTVLFGAMAGSGALPFDRQACEAAIRQSGKAVQASLAGFAAGYDRARGVAASEAPPMPGTATAFPARVAALPPALREVASHGVELVADYQDQRYAGLYLDRVERMLRAEQAHGGGALDVSRETARYLALWMSYEDVIRVADLKTRRERLARVRREVGAGQQEPLHVTEFLKPGLDEVCSVLPPGLAGWLRRRLTRRLGKQGMGLHVRTSTVGGFALLCLLRGLRRWRPRTERYHQEQALIERWLQHVQALLPISPPAALELALCGNLVKGYGETSERGHRNLGAILDDTQRCGSVPDLTERIAAARRAALADPQGKALARALDLPDPPMIEQPLRFVRKAASS
ncbi:pyruvate ferredoxin/flavodoxin oxidoreductase family protein [Bordetella holmesii 30539]|uniref:Pyruvate ferredoxin/flavodoxin oxidoreductase family protein n=1 Tax=Bordetella holmesii 1058 TaxID=1247648 RepID=A0ABP3BNF2_9BORD|nr:pyruvate ferredoxin/flavodoxin oxidoreductase family protein [Bordetella holmesii 44057]EWM41834.1 pyruvate ferredoxin/flavodoxin oxidoreductase family protein [Bordetella holmesii 41130]EWM46192.1 pyruvate ferredoxin/flavodoxin oxidoreductase family protein [Bordetella holmesii 35009]EXF89249.1 pyruvate ferredoxin/flavodoxin oxidoreductase family protein [Bordetella holmesii 30539]EXX95455.1 pyruvate ferredoxin/flavodoxin oxidoreductase family protein [Bordetella holmesii 1058]